MNRLIPIKLSVLLLYCFTALSQSPKFRALNFPVDKSNKSFRMPWVGGLNSPQFSHIELNGDQWPDLFIFDRVGDKVLTYINKGVQSGDTAYEYAPQYESLFPDDLKSWALIRDYNLDNIPDIFTHTNTGTRVYKGFIQNGKLKFSIVNHLLTYNDGTFDVNIWTNIDDIPVVTDVNRDGDLDILTFGIFGSTVEYYENQTKENLGNPSYAYDSLKFRDGSFCWGNFSENSLNNSITLNISCKGGGQLNVDDASRHVGSTIFDFDADNDHDVDLLIGDISFNSLVFVQNCGDSSFANVCYSDTSFPSCNKPVNVPVFPAAYSIDADNDGIKDLIVSPNARVSIDVKNALFYKNVNTACGWSFTSDSFLTYHSLDLGTDSKPVFFDFNYDGLQDIVVGNFGYYRENQPFKSSIAILENTGTSDKPSFSIITTDYGNFSSFNLVGMHPAFGDMDGDGLPDMIVGELNGYLHFFKNTGSSTANFSSLTSPQYFGLDAGQYSAPFISDVNGDSLNDLLVGRRDGKITYYRNFGTKTSPQFHQDSSNTFFGGVNVNMPGFTEGYSTPVIHENTNGERDLLVGTNRGLVYRYSIDTTKLQTGNFALLDTNFIGFDAGSETTISIADINDDGKFEYMLGNSRGGILMYSDTLLDTSVVLKSASIEQDGDFLLYPNPTDQILNIQLTQPVSNQIAFHVFDMQGQKVKTDYSSNEGGILTLNTGNFTKGVYILTIISGHKLYHKRFCVIH